MMKKNSYLRSARSPGYRTALGMETPDGNEGACVTGVAIRYLYVVPINRGGDDEKEWLSP